MGSRGFLLQFLSLAALSGTTLGMSKLITTFYALGLGASAAQIGYISAAEALGMVVLTLPAGLLIDRLGSKKLYLFASLLPAALHLTILCWSSWLWLAAMRFLIGGDERFVSATTATTRLEQGRMVSRCVDDGHAVGGTLAGRLVV